MEYSFSQTFGKSTVTRPLLAYNNSPQAHDPQIHQNFCEKIFDSEQSELEQSRNIQSNILRNRQNICSRNSQASKIQGRIKNNAQKFKENNQVNILSQNKEDHVFTTPKFIKGTSSHQQLPTSHSQQGHQEADELSSKVMRLLEQLRKDNKQKSIGQRYRSKTLGKQSKSVCNFQGPSNEVKNRNGMTKVSSYSILPQRKQQQKASFAKLAKSYKLMETQLDQHLERKKQNSFSSREFLENIKQNDPKFSILSNIETINTSISTNKSKTRFFQKDYGDYGYSRTQKENNTKNLNLKYRQKGSENLVRTIQSEFSSDQISSEVRTLYQESITEYRQEKTSFAKNKNDLNLNENEANRKFSAKINQISQKIDDYQRRVNNSLYSKGKFDKKERYNQRIDRDYQKREIKNGIKNSLHTKRSEQEFQFYEQTSNKRREASEENARSRKQIIEDESSTSFGFRQSFNINDLSKEESSGRKSNVFESLFSVKPIPITHENQTCKVGIEIVNQITIDEQFRKAKKQFSKIPQDLKFKQNRRELSKWGALRFRLIRFLQKYNLQEFHQELFDDQKYNYNGQGMQLEEIFQMKDDQADPFYSITLENNSDQLSGILDNICQLYIASEENYRQKIVRNFSHQEVNELLSLIKNSTIALDEFIIAINELTRCNYKCRDGYLLYCRLKGIDIVLSRVHLQGKMIKQSTY